MEQQSFDIEQKVRMNASRKKVFNALTENIDQWWSERLFKESMMAKLHSGEPSLILIRKKNFGWTVYLACPVR